MGLQVTFVWNKILGEKKLIYIFFVCLLKSHNSCEWEFLVAGLARGVVFKSILFLWESVVTFQIFSFLKLK